MEQSARGVSLQLGVDGFLTTEQKIDLFSCSGGILDNEFSVKSPFLLFTQNLAPSLPWRSSIGRPTPATLSCLLGQCLLLLICVVFVATAAPCYLLTPLQFLQLFDVLRHGCVEFCWEEDELQVNMN
jgi:hypothetical protein